jgi:hypothetical protein
MAGWAHAHQAEVTDQALIKEMRDEGKHINRLSNIVLKRTDGSTDRLELALAGDQDVWLWILSHSLLTIDQFDQNNWVIYQTLGQPILLMFIDPTDVNSDGYFHILKRVADTYDEGIRYAWIDVSKPYNLSRMAELGLKSEILPSFYLNLFDSRQITFP